MARHPVTIGEDKPNFQYQSGMPSTPAVSEWATKEDLGSCSASCLSDFPAKSGGFVGALGDSEASIWGVYFAEAKAPVAASLPAAKAPVAAFSMR